MDDYPHSTLQLLADLVACPSVCGTPNDRIIRYIESYLAGCGVPSRRIPDKTGTKASLLATIGPSHQPGLVLSAHTDVVPVEGQDWATSPFTTTVKDGRVFGRGTTDMKGFIACVLARVPDFVRAATKVPVHLAFSYDEELGCLGTPDLADALAKLECRPAFCLVGEPTSMEIVRAHKGKRAFHIDIKGRSGHSASPHRGLDAVRIATLIAGQLNELQATICKNGGRDAAFDPPQTTIHLGSLHGGHALNIIPDHATLEFEIRNLPGVDADEVLRELWEWIDELRAQCQTQACESDITVVDMIDYPPLAAAGNEVVARLCANIFGSKENARGVSYGTEAGIIRAGLASQLSFAAQAT